MEIINSEFAKIRPSFCSPGIFFDRLEIWTNYIIFIRILKLGAGTYHGTKKHNPPKINLYPLISQILLKVYDINFLFLNLIINFITILLYYIFKYYLDYIYIYICYPPKTYLFWFYMCQTVAIFLPDKVWLRSRNRAKTYPQKLPNVPSEFLEKIYLFLSPAAVVWWVQAASIRPPDAIVCI